MSTQVIEPAGQAQRSEVAGSAPYVVAGRCMLVNGDEYPCTAHRITAQGAEIVVKAQAAVGTPVICYLDNIGILRGTVRSSGRDRFVLVFDITETRRARVLARIAWHADRAAESAEQRMAPRIVPIRRETEVRLGENIVCKAWIADLSMSGVAVTVEDRFQPFVGSLVWVGKRAATVVRLIDGGFAAEFKLPFNRETFNEHVVL